MADLTRKSWPLGWIPSDSDVNGRKDGLLRMDNLRLDERGALTLVNGISKVNTVAFGGYVHSIFSRYISGSKHRFIGTSDGKVLQGTGATPAEIITGGSTVKTAFGAAFGQVFACSASKKKKFDGTNTYDITPEAPAAGPALSNGTDPAITWVTNDYSNFTIDEGTITAKATYLDIETDTHRAVVNDYVTHKDFTAFPNSNDPLEWDRFELHIRIGDTRKLKMVRVEFLLDATPSDHFNYLEHEWWMDAGEFTPGINAWSVLTTHRKNFGRHGRAPGVGWADVQGVRIVIETEGVIDSVVIAGSGILFQGGTGGPLQGKYKYAQLNVADDGSNQYKSELSPATDLIECTGNQIVITPTTPTDPQVNKVWIYRRSAEASVDLTEPNQPRMLGDWYRVKEVATPFAAFNDEVLDEDALLDDIRYDARQQAVSDIPDDILDIAGPTASGRMIYMTFNRIYISSAFDPGVYIAQHVIKLSGSTTEKNLWVAKVGKKQVYVGTSEDIYSISGTFAELPDGSLDIFIDGLGTAYPPISFDYAQDFETVFYVAKDGIRGMSGGTTRVLNGPLDALFNGRTCHGIAPVSIVPRGSIVYSMATGKGCLWVSVYNTDTTRRLYVYDLKRQYWYPYFTDPIALHYEEDGIMLAGYGGGSGNFLRVIDSGTTIDGSGGQDIYFQTVFDDDELPRSRKDTYTLKITADCGGDSLTPYIAKDGGSFSALAAKAFDGYTENVWDLESLTLGTTYALRLVGTGLTQCDIFEVNIEYNPRPAQQTSLIIHPSNLGTTRRKRLVNFPFVIDTLGNTVTFTPIADGSNQTASTTAVNRKATHTHYFGSELIATDIGGKLTGGPFEFYEVLYNEIASEVLPNPTTFLVIPPSDLGNPNRKRLPKHEFQINTNGANVTYTPFIDEVAGTPSTVNTNSKQIHEHYFATAAKVKNIGGTLASTGTTPFEYYGPIIPPQMEILPPRVKVLRIPNSNFGIPAKKKISVLPYVIDTDGKNATFTPIIDEVAGTPSTVNKGGKLTALHQFADEAVGIDFGGLIESNDPFEFYSLERPEHIEILPIAKAYDQLGPIEFNRAGLVKSIRIRAITTGAFLPYKLYLDEAIVHQDTFICDANKDRVYEHMRLPPNLTGTICKVVLGDGTNSEFHRYWLELHVKIFGDKTQVKVFKF